MNKRAKVIDYLSENCSSETVITLLMQFVSEENWEQLYDQLKNDGIPDFCESEEPQSNFEKAVAYVRENMDEDELNVIRATVSKNMKDRYPVAHGIDESKVIDLLEAYGQDNDLPEGWWGAEFGIEEIMFEL